MDSVRCSRRKILSSIAGLSISSGLLTKTAAASTTKNTSSTLQTGAVELGTFEDGIDGWETSGSAELSRVSTEKRPSTVAEGDYALRVDPNGDGYPAIRNGSDVRGSDYTDTPFLVGSISTQAVPEYDHLTLVLTYHHKPIANGVDSEHKDSSKNSTQQSGSRNGHPRAERQTLTVPLWGQTTFSWALSDLPKEALSVPQEINIGWYLGETPPKTGPNGKQVKSDDPGVVYFDAISMVADRTLAEEAAQRNYLDGYVSKHGFYDYEVTEYLKDGERGEYVFQDGTRINVEWYKRGPEREEMLIDGRSFKRGGGWE